MKKILLLLVTLLTAINFSACGVDKHAQNNSDTIKVVTTIFPAYDWTRAIVGDEKNFELTLLGGTGVDLHSFQPTAQDIAKISDCDVFIYVGGKSEAWVNDALKQVTNKNLVVVKLLDVLGNKVKHEEISAGMQDEHKIIDKSHHSGSHHSIHSESHHDSSHENSAHETHAPSVTHENLHEDETHSSPVHYTHTHRHHHDKPEIDEHVWLSLKNAQILCDAIADALIKVDPSNEKTFRTNVAAYKEKLAALDKNYKQTVDDAPVKTLLFGDRFPFRYLVDDYGLKYFAAFSGCSAETEASFSTIKFLADKVDELNLHYVIKIDGATHKIAETIVKNTKTKEQTILTLDSMQSAGTNANYLDVMTKNLEVLREALSK